MNLSPCLFRSLFGRCGAGGADAEAIEGPDTEPRGLREELSEGRLESVTDIGGVRCGSARWRYEEDLAQFNLSNSVLVESSP